MSERMQRDAVQAWTHGKMQMAPARSAPVAPVEPWLVTALATQRITHLLCTPFCTLSRLSHRMCRATGSSALLLIGSRHLQRVLGREARSQLFRYQTPLHEWSSFGSLQCSIQRSRGSTIARLVGIATVRNVQRQPRPLVLAERLPRWNRNST